MWDTTEDIKTTWMFVAPSDSQLISNSYTFRTPRKSAEQVRAKIS